MQTRFLALIRWDPTTCPRTRPDVSNTSLNILVSTARLWLAVDGANSVRLPTGDGALVGHVFLKGTPSRRAEPSDIDPSQLDKAGGADLMDAVWGGYVAFLTGQDGTIYVIRDPSGAMPCVSVATPEGLAVASDVDMLVSHGLLVPHIDWSAMVRHLLAYDFRDGATCLVGVSEIPAGYRVTVGGATWSQAPLWSPWDYTDPDRKADPGALAEALRGTLHDTVTTWASAFHHIVLGVSGGLDSSVLAALLIDGPTPLTCYTMVTDEAEGDERSFSRALSTHLRVAIAEHHYQLDHVDITRATAPHLPRPLRLAFGQSDHHAKLTLASRVGADAFFTGIGGDNVFCNMTSARPVADRLLRQGPSLGVLQTLNDVCDLAGCSYWQALTKVARVLPPGQRHTPWLQSTRFLNPDVLGVTSVDFQHPWLAHATRSLPGKWSHVAMLARIQGTLDGFRRSDTAPLVNPLLSQPVVEACLRIPTWLWCDGGYNRALVRKAFASRLPETILRRRSKGGPGSFAQAVIEAQRHRLLDILLNGFAAREGLLDLDGIERTLRSDAPIDDLDYPRFGFLAELEAWAAHWSARAADEPPSLR